MSKGEETFKTDDFLIYVFDTNNTSRRFISYHNINSKSFFKNVAFISLVY